MSSATDAPVLDGAPADARTLRKLNDQLRRNIAERERIERALRDSEQRFRDYTRAAGDWFWETDADLRFTFISERLTELTGLVIDHFIGRSRAEVGKSAEEPERWAGHLEDLRQRRAFRDFTYSVEHPDGRRLHFRTNGVPVFDDDGRFTGYRGTGIDVTAEVEADERYRAMEARIVESERLFRAVIDQSTSAIYLKDLQGRFILVNRELKRRVDLDDPDILGKTERELVPEMVAEAFTRQDRLVMETGKPDVRELDVTVNGCRRTLLVTNFPVCDSSGVMVGLAAISTDISERKRAEEALAQQKRLFETIFDHVPDALVYTDPSRVVRMCNPGVTRTFGYSSEQVVGASTRVFFPSDREWRRLGKLSFDPEATSSATPVIGSCRRADGQLFPVEATGATVRDAGGDVLGHLTMIRDITEREQGERERAQLGAQLRQAQKMEAIGQLTGGISHDFNNILANILGYAGLALDYCVEDKSSQLAEYLRHVQRAGERARDLIAQMLTFSRMGTTESRPLILSTRVQEAIKLLRSTLPTSIELDVRCEDELPPVLLDPIELDQLVMNLCINARDAMSGKGRIQVRLERWSGDGRPCDSCQVPIEGEWISLGVIDSGPGIAGPIKARMFDPFFTTKEVGQGTGMGLSVVHGIVHRNGGHIVVDSPEGGGLGIRLAFPVAAEPGA